MSSTKSEGTPSGKSRHSSKSKGSSKEDEKRVESVPSNSWQSVISFEKLAIAKLRPEEKTVCCPCCEIVVSQASKIGLKTINEVADHLYLHFLPHIEKAGYGKDVIRINGFKSSMVNFCQVVLKKRCTSKQRQDGLDRLYDDYASTFVRNVPVDNDKNISPDSENREDPFLVSEARNLILDPEKDKETIRSELRRVQEGILVLEEVKSQFQSAGLNLAPAADKLMKQIEEFLNRGKVAREEVTDKVDDVFEFTRCSNDDNDQLGGIDLYTGWSKEEFDNVLSIPEIDRVNVLFKSKDKRSFYEVDHVWEVQLVHLALRELLRFQAATPSSGALSDSSLQLIRKYQFSLVEMNFLTKIINSFENLNCTPWNINNYKGKLMKNFRGTYQITKNALNYGVRSYLVGNRNFLFMTKTYPTFKEVWQKAGPTPNAGPSPNAAAEENDGETEKQSIMDNIQNAMRNVLTGFLYLHLLAVPDPDDTNMESRLLNRDVLKLLYGIFCDMYNTMYS